MSAPHHHRSAYDKANKPFKGKSKAKAARSKGPPLRSYFVLVFDSVLLPWPCFQSKGLRASARRS